MGKHCRAEDMQGLAGTLSALLAMLALSCSVVYAADPSLPKTYKIAAQPVSTALKAFAAQSDLQLLYTESDVRGAKTPGVTGTRAPEAALAELLKGTGLEFEFTANSVVVVRKVSAAGLATAAAKDPPNEDSLKEGGKTSSRDFRVAHLDQAGAGNQQVEQGQPGTTQSAQLQEVIVTAQKRQQRLQDVPVPVSVVNAGALEDSNQLRVQDYYAQVPGLTASLNNSGAANLAIRGISTGDGANPTVGIVVDDIPYGSSTVLGSGAAVPDIDPSDLVQIEVLRGPQGTLYGASSIGGLLKFVTVDPSTDGLSGRLESGVSSVHNGNELGYSFRGEVNVPVTDTVALRASGFTRRDPGYIDNIETGEKGINRGDADGGRLSVLWLPSQDFSIKLGVLFQDNRTYGSPNVMIGPGLGDLQQEALRDTGGYDDKIESYSAIVKGKVAGFDVTSATGYNINKTFLPQDLSSVLGGAPSSSEFGVDGALTLYEADTHKFSEELRMTRSVGSKLDWLLGGFYTHEVSSVVSPILAVSSTTGAFGGAWLESDAPSTYKEYAAFTDLTLHLTDRFDLQLGGRESRDDQTYSQVQSGPYVTMFLVQPSPFVQGPIDTSETAFTYLITPSFKLTTDSMLYARLASGYRPGGPNVGGVAFHAPLNYAPDKTQNYEIGIKGSVLDHRLSFDASIYRINWQDIQIVAVDPVSGAAYEVNGSRATSQGVELSIDARPIEGMTVAANTSWNDAHLTEPFPAASSVFGSPDDRLPYAARISGRLSVEQQFPLGESVKGFVSAAESYVGNRLGEFASVFSSPARQYYPPYAQTDLRAGMIWQDWRINMFATNVTDKRGVLNGGLNFFPPNAFIWINPRTVAIAVRKKFSAQ